MMDSEKFVGQRTGVESTLARPESSSAWFMQPFGGERTTITRKLGKTVGMRIAP